MGIGHGRDIADRTGNYDAVWLFYDSRLGKTCTGDHTHDSDSGDTNTNCTINTISVVRMVE